MLHFNRQPLNPLAQCPETVGLANGIYEGRITRDKLEVLRQVCTYSTTEQLMNEGVELTEWNIHWQCTLDTSFPGIDILATVVVTDGWLAIHNVGFVALATLTEGRGRVYLN